MQPLKMKRYHEEKSVSKVRKRWEKEEWYRETVLQVKHQNRK